MMSSMSENLIAQSFCPRENPTGLNTENRFKHQTLTHRVGDFVVNGDWTQTGKQGVDQERVGQPCGIAGICTGNLDPENRKDMQLSLCDSQHGCLSAQKQDVDHCTGSEELYGSVNNVEDKLPCDNINEEAHDPVFEWSELDQTVALWVKWRGKWQAGIRCARADCPLATLKARPTHDRKKYFVVFFPHTRNYSWADLLLVRPVNEFPEPVAHGTHDRGLEKVKDLSLPRRFIMQRLAVGMLNIIDRLHNEAVVENARKVTTWKEFSLEASRCNCYSDLGGMLLQLQSMILQQYLDPDWLKNSLGSWAHGCQNAQSAESVEILKEELENSVLWNAVEALWDAPVQPELGSEWKTWKQEVMKWFSISHPIASVRDVEQECTDDSISAGLPSNNKRAKLEVRRAEVHASQLESSVSLEVQSQANTDNLNSGILSNGSPGIASRLEFDSYKDTYSAEEAAAECSGSVTNKWDEIVVEPKNNEFRTTGGQEMPADRGSVGKSLESGYRYQQCTAFIEAKGRQCIRWANDGDVYCCVHLAVRSPATITKAGQPSPVDAPMCEGTTVHGTKCKHRSQYGSTFCKKHRPQNSQYLMDMELQSSSPVNMLKRSHSEISPMVATGSCKEMMLATDVQNPAQVNSVASMQGENFVGKASLVQKIEHSVRCNSNSDFLCCIGTYPQRNSDLCPENAKLHTLYCEKHLPNFLKRARNGKSRIISKEVFLDFLRNCSSREKKLHLHRACVLLHGYVKTVVSNRNPLIKEAQLHLMLSEASNDLCVGECLMKLISREKEKLKALWGFDVGNDKRISSGVSVPQPAAENSSHSSLKTLKCKICSKEFLDDEMLGAHWIDVHKKEAQSLFRGYTCAICLTSFTDKKVLETHVWEKHEVQFVEQCSLFHCIPCGSRYSDPEQLWMHVLSVHSKDFELWNASQQLKQSAKEASQLFETGKSDRLEKSWIKDGSQGVNCKFCGIKCDHSIDLDRHHQAAHMGLNSITHMSPKREILLNPYKSKSGRIGRPTFPKGLQNSSYRIRKRANMRIKKRLQASGSANTGAVKLQYDVPDVAGLGRLEEPQCSAVAKILFAEIQKAKPRPSNFDILAVARSTCCKINLQVKLEEQFGVLPERLYLKAAKLCSDMNIQVKWHQKGFVCPKGCQAVQDPLAFSSLVPLPSCFVEFTPSRSADSANTTEEWEMDECHLIVETNQIRPIAMEEAIILCEDLSFGKEPVPVNCVVDDDLVNSLHTIDNIPHDAKTVCPMPWEGFKYVTERLVDPSLSHAIESSHLGCACPHPVCSPEECDHVYLFENDYGSAKDIHGGTMCGKFPYDGEGRIILEEGYLVYECSSKCACDRTCPNRVLQNGVKVKLEVFKTENKGWAVRAGEAISRGRFVCEYIGELLNDQEADKRKERYNNEDCCYLYKFEADVNDMGGLIEGVVPIVIDATRYGNISRFINHSCSPNLVSYQVLVESMDSQLAHIGLYASRDIAVGEELAYDYHHKLLLSGEQPCHCGAACCRGRIS